MDDLRRKLRASLISRLLHIQMCPKTTAAADTASVAVLFSGGLDCSVLACIAHEILSKKQDIDLLNVAFENPRVCQAAKITRRSEAPSSFNLCPDRITGLSSYAEILQKCPGRTWRFVAINITYTELQAHRSQIKSLILPRNTEMDFSIGCALYFAARGKGIDLDAGDGRSKDYSTSARVLLSGLGADELFAGYTRHATAFERKGYAGLVSELKLDFNRLWERNLGRDDRVISHWGREVRYPYLDEDLVSWALSIPVWEKCGFGHSHTHEQHQAPRLEPGKRLLRLLAWELGLHGAAAEKKRAIQFGARTAKMEAGRTKGTDVLL